MTLEPRQVRDLTSSLNKMTAAANRLAAAVEKHNRLKERVPDEGEAQDGSVEEGSSDGYLPPGVSRRT